MGLISTNIQVIGLIGLSMATSLIFVSVLQFIQMKLEIKKNLNFLIFKPLLVCSVILLPISMFLGEILIVFAIDVFILIPFAITGSVFGFIINRWLYNKRNA